MHSAHPAGTAHVKKRKKRRFQPSDFALDAQGRWRSRGRQVVTISYRGERLGELALGPGRWAVLAALISAAIDARIGLLEVVYQTKDDIAEFLRSVGSPFAYKSHIKAYLHDLRADIDAFLRQHLGASGPHGGWGEFMIPTHALGYHLAIPSENLGRTILDR